MDLIEIDLKKLIAWQIDKHLDPFRGNTVLWKEIK